MILKILKSDSQSEILNMPLSATDRLYLPLVSVDPNIVIVTVIFVDRVPVVNNPLPFIGL